MKFFKLTTLLVLLLSTTLSLAGNEGGGGDASEARVNEIRSDILKWINDGGANGLVFPPELSYEGYLVQMTNILQAKKVVIGFVMQDDGNDDELKVNVNGIPKTCRGFISIKDFKPHILCNIPRFENTSESEQYKLIHHEYAGLVEIERNDEAASDYELSNQITGFLSRQTVLRLAIKPSMPGHLSADGMVLYDHVVSTGYGYYEVYMPKIKGTDGNFYSVGVEAFKVIPSGMDPKASRIIDTLIAPICRSLQLSANSSHAPRVSDISPDEQFIKGLFESPQTQKKHWLSKELKKLSVIQCENIYDPSRRGPYGSTHVEIEVVGGVIIIRVKH